MQQNLICDTKINGCGTRTRPGRYYIVSLKNVEDAGAKLDAWSKAKQTA